MRLFRVGVVASVLVGVVPLFASPVGAATVCGSTITTNTVLDTDLTCAQQGLSVNGTNITLDLGGHTIRGAGPNTVPAAPFGVTAGVRINVGSGITVRNGTIRGFNAGVTTTTAASGNVISGLTVSGNRDGVYIQNNPSTGATSDGNRIVNNTVTGSTAVGIRVNGNNNVVESNTVVDGVGNGIGVAGTSSGPNLTVRNNTVRSNNVANNGRGPTPGAASVFIVNAVNTVVVANSVGGIGTGPGIFVSGGSTGTQVTFNRAYGNADGIWIGVNSAGSTVSSNQSVQNTADGIRVTSTSAVLTGNFAYGNGALGIDAAAGVVDGGGNRAMANGSPQQCTPNINCT